MAFFRRKKRRHLIPLHRDNARSDDWLLILEANTIVARDREAFGLLAPRASGRS